MFFLIGVGRGVILEVNRNYLGFRFVCDFIFNYLLFGNHDELLVV